MRDEAKRHELIGVVVRRAWVAVCAALLVSVLPGSAFAQREDNGNFRVSVGSVVAGYNGYTLDVEGPSSAAPSTEVKTEGAIGGIARPQLELSGRPTEGAWFGVTARLGVTDLAVEVGGMRVGTSTFRWALLGHVEYVFAPGSQVRPYLKLLLGGSGFESGDSTSAGFNVGGDIGMHIFAADNISVSPSIQFDYVTGSGSFGGSDAGYNEVVVGGALTLTGWFGAPSEPEDAESDERERYEGQQTNWGQQPAPPETAPAVTSSSTPTAPSVPRAADRREEVLLVDGDFTVSVVGAPHSRPGQIALRVERVAAGSLACNELLITTEASATRTTLGERSSRPVGTAVRDVIVGLTTLEVARHATSEVDTALILCGHPIWLTPPAKAALSGFLDRYERASGGGAGVPGAGEGDVEGGEEGADGGADGDSGAVETEPEG